MGVMFTLYIITKKEAGTSVSNDNYYENMGLNMETDPNKIFDRLTRINYITGQKNVGQKQISL